MTRVWKSAPRTQHRRIICALITPQAKGRVERANRTLQDRLVKELRLAGICTMEEGNAFLPAFIQDHNIRFAKDALNPKNLHRSLGHAESLNDVFAWREERMVSTTLTIQYDKSFFLLEPNIVTKPLARKRVTISEYPDGRVVISHNGLPLPYKVFDTVRHVDQGAIVENKRLSVVLQHIQHQRALRPENTAASTLRRGVPKAVRRSMSARPLSRKTGSGCGASNDSLDRSLDYPQNGYARPCQSNR